jgi:AraC family transcriptional regulator
VAELSRLPMLGERRRPRWLQTVEDAIEAAGADTPSVTDLAAIAGVHASHLLRTFRRYHGATVATYVRRRRIERARAEVAKGDRPLSMIALDAGFSDQSHFTRVFRQTFGETPARYARSMRGR